VSTKTLDAAFVQQFDDCLAYGVENIASAIEEKADESPLNKEKTLSYLTKRIDYFFDEAKREALARFLALVSAL
jgi:hypothetical protein